MTASTNYVAISRRALDLEDYIDVARRHTGWIAGPAFAGLVISICIAFFQPNTYDSTAWMQITPAQVSEDLVKNTVNQQLYERIIQLQSQIQSRGTLSAIITDPRFKLYPSEVAKKPLEDVIDMMKRDIHISLGQSDPNIARRGGSTFSISFSYPQRLKAQQVVQELVTRFENENEQLQSKQQNILKDFVGEELTSAKANLEKRNEELTRFRNENQGRLPEQSQMNMTNLQSLQAQLLGMNDQLNRLATDRVRLEAQRSTLQNELRLAESMAQDMPGTSLFSPVTRQNEELLALNKEIDAGDLRMQQLLQQYKPTYPDIKNLQSQLQILKKHRDDLQQKHDKEIADDAAKPKAEKKPTNYPAEQNKNQIQGQLAQTEALLRNNDTDRENKLKQQERLNSEIEAYRGRLAATSSIEARYADLQRDYANAGQTYQDMLHKKEITSQNGDLIQRKATENLEVLDAPSLPEKPTKPNRWEIVGVGFGVSMVLGLALAGIQEARDTSLKNLKDVRAYTNLPVLSSIPLLENSMVVKRKKRITYLIWSAAVIAGMVAVAASLFYYYTVTATS